MVLQCSKLFYCKVSNEFLRQDSQSSRSFVKIQNVRVPELSQEKNSVSLKNDLIFFTYSIKTSVQNTINIKNGESNEKNEMEIPRISWKTQY